MEEELPLTPSQQKMVELWEKHTASEFVTKSIEDTMSTMTQEPFVNHVPAMTGGLGLDNVRKFYSKYFIPTATTACSTRFPVGGTPGRIHGITIVCVNL